MRFEAEIKRNGEKIFDGKGNAEVEEILLELDGVVKRETKAEKK